MLYNGPVYLLKLVDRKTLMILREMQCYSFIQAEALQHSLQKCIDMQKVSIEIVRVK